MKYKHTEETKIVLEDLTNRVMQLIEVNELHLGAHDKRTDTKLRHQNRAFGSVLTLLDQVSKTGHVMRGNSAFPDPIEPLAKTKWLSKQQLFSEAKS